MSIECTRTEPKSCSGLAVLFPRTHTPPSSPARQLLWGGWAATWVLGFRALHPVPLWPTFVLRCRVTVSPAVIHVLVNSDRG